MAGRFYTPAPGRTLHFRMVSKAKRLCLCIGRMQIEGDIQGLKPFPKNIVLRGIVIGATSVAIHQRPLQTQLRYGALKFFRSSFWILHWKNRKPTQSALMGADAIRQKIITIAGAFNCACCVRFSLNTRTSLRQNRQLNVMRIHEFKAFIIKIR